MTQYMITRFQGIYQTLQERCDCLRTEDSTRINYVTGNLLINIANGIEVQEENRKSSVYSLKNLHRSIFALKVYLRSLEKYPSFNDVESAGEIYYPSEENSLGIEEEIFRISKRLRREFGY